MVAKRPRHPKNQMPYEFDESLECVPKWAMLDDGKCLVPLRQSKNARKHLANYYVAIYQFSIVVRSSRFNFTTTKMVMARVGGGNEIIISHASSGCDFKNFLEVQVVGFMDILPNFLHASQHIFVSTFFFQRKQRRKKKKK